MEGQKMIINTISELYFVIEVGKYLSLIYALEFNLNCIVRDEYLLSFYFWLDMISTLTLFQDIDYIMNPLMGYEPISNSKIQKNLKKSERVSTAVSQVSSATRATRVLRVVRIARLFRMIKIYKSVLQAKVNKEKQQNEEKRKLLEIIEEESSDMSPVSPGKRKTTNDNLTNNQMNNSDGINKIIKKLKSNVRSRKASPKSPSSCRWKHLSAVRRYARNQRQRQLHV